MACATGKSVGGCAFSSSLTKTGGVSSDAPKLDRLLETLLCKVKVQRGASRQTSARGLMQLSTASRACHAGWPHPIKRVSRGSSQGLGAAGECGEVGVGAPRQGL